MIFPSSDNFICFAWWQWQFPQTKRRRRRKNCHWWHIQTFWWTYFVISILKASATNNNNKNCIVFLMTDLTRAKIKATATENTHGRDLPCVDVFFQLIWKIRDFFFLSLSSYWLSFFLLFNFFLWHWLYLISRERKRENKKKNIVDKWMHMTHHARIHLNIHIQRCHKQQSRWEKERWMNQNKNNRNKNYIQNSQTEGSGKRKKKKKKTDDMHDWSIVVKHLNKISSN